MAAKSTIAKRYARAFAETFTDTAKAVAAQAEFEGLVLNISTDKKLSEFMTSPAFDRTEKWGVFSGLLEKAGATKSLTDFLRVLLEADRLAIIEEVLVEFNKVLMDRLGEAEAHVETAYALTESELATIKSNLEKTTGKKLRVSVELKPELVAGLRVNVDGKTFDGTLATHLNRLQRQLSQAQA